MIQYCISIYACNQSLRRLIIDWIETITHMLLADQGRSTNGRGLRSPKAHIMHMCQCSHLIVCIRVHGRVDNTRLCVWGALASAPVDKPRLPRLLLRRRDREVADLQARLSSHAQTPN